ncbi:extracellular solute-binding protein [Cohnella yongneupensis]|uniref:extracellular solute-binding protein n=1 Tax=Cohnella yongneupensis TaxID=425006 RepID=UPI003A8E55CC
MKRKQGFKKYMLTAMAVVLLFSTPGLVPGGKLQVAYALENHVDPIEEPLDYGSDLLDATDDRMPYIDYMVQLGDKVRPKREIIVNASDYSGIKGMEARKLEDYEGVAGTSIATEEQGSIEWEINVEEDGLYNMSALYFPMEGKSSDIERSLLIDGAIPFKEANYLQFQRMWGNESADTLADNQGNELRPKQVERPRWQEEVFKDMEGYHEAPYLFYLSQGKHTLTMVSQREPMIIRYLKIYQVDEPLPYEELRKQYEEQGLKESEGQLIVVQGEDAASKSSPTLYPLSDRSSPAVYPYSASKVKINTIGGYNWRLSGQWIEWEVTVPEDGLYKIGFKSKQNFVRGIYSTRRLTIDGSVPFAEMDEVAFKYNKSYRMDVMGDDDPYMFHLTEGKHVLRLEVSLGQYAALIREVEQSLLNLNTQYRKILMVTGTAPDEIRDYRLDKQIPGLIEGFQTESDRLKTVVDRLKSLSGQSSDQEALLKTMSLQLDEMIANPDTIPSRLKAFKVNTGGIGTWILKAKEQPLEIDAIYIASPSEKLPSGKASFFARLWHLILTFFYSFIIDYNQVGDVADRNKKTITVWIGSGRDQATTIKSLIDETFTPKTGISVNLKLVQMQTLLPATLAGQGPDVAMQIGNDIPVNYAMRNAVENLARFNDFESVSQRFRSSAMVPYTYNSGVYALPETQTFNMLFYRKDILKELGLNVPQTWEDVEKQLAVLNKNHMEFGLPITTQPSYPGENLAPNSVYAMKLLQSGGEFYRNDGKESSLDSAKGVEAFKQWTEYYTDYKLTVEYDFASRFRTGEMPVGIADYTTYNQLSVSAPEIRGMWGFAPVPGTLQQDGTINREVPGGGNAVIMLKQAEDKDAAWEFMKWWTSTDVQTMFGREMEGLMGAAARYPTANIEALDRLPWPINDYKNLKAQFEWVQGIPEVPGGYFTGRHLMNAFYKVVNKQVDPREAIITYSQYVQDEIRLKRNEFGLPN